MASIAKKEMLNTISLDDKETEKGGGNPNVETQCTN